MPEQQNFDSQAAPDYFAFKAALDAESNNMSGNNSLPFLPFPPGFVYASQSQGDPLVGGNVPYTDHRPFHPTSSIIEPGNFTPFLPSPMYELNEILIRLNNMKYVLYENLSAIEELTRRIHVLSLSGSRTTNPVTPSHHSQYGFKLSQDATHYIPPIASSSNLGTTPSYAESSLRAATDSSHWTTAPTASFPFNFYTDLNKVSPKSPVYEVIVDKGVKHFRCGCGHQTKTKADMSRHHKCLKHSQPSYFCGCGKSYTRDDALDRHQKTCRRQKGV